jgi:2,4-dienoyl-CoA reductase-like NADH-dependent reductase (Old Yellow Enzyme family)/NADPH-dependent 2,4-dienoyl-CoA reductase/sulfur reductase-like enzyme
MTKAEPAHSLPRLFEPGHIGTLRLKNRIVMSPMATELASDTGAVTQRQIDHYVRRAQGGVGLIIVEFTCIDYPRGKGQPSQLSLHDDKLLAGHGDLVEAVHRAGAKVGIQLHHAGANSDVGATEGRPLVAPAPIPSRATQQQPHTLERAEIEELVEKFARAVERAKKAGYDLVELHGAHGYLIAQFMSPYINTRTDDYGGTLQKRMKFPLDIIARAQELVGPDYPLTMRISGQELVPGGRSVEESKEVAQILENAGLDAIHVSGGVDTDLEWAVDPVYHVQGCKTDVAGEIKTAINIPVIAVGVIREPAFAEDVLAQGKADFVAIGRGLLTDPDWPLKAARGEETIIRKCISCNYCLMSRTGAGLTIRCIINTDLGLAIGATNLEASSEPKQVMVVGGGPAGMEVARLAALRGHGVTLYDENTCLGGQLLVAAKAPNKDKLSWLVEDLVRELGKSSVDVKLGLKVTADLVRESAPDVLVLATGARPYAPDIVGVDRTNVVNAWDVLSGRALPVGGRVCVIGGNSTGCEVALHLTERLQKQVVIMEQLNSLAVDMEPFAQRDIMKTIASDSRAEVVQGARATGISDEGVSAVDSAGNQSTINCDWVVLATGVKARTELHDSLLREGLAGVSMFSIGDGSRPENIAAALDAGRALGRQL